MRWAEYWGGHRGALLIVSSSEPSGGSSGSSGGALRWLLALLTITVGGVAAPYWLQLASTIVGMVTGIVGVVIGLAG